MVIHHCIATFFLLHIKGRSIDETFSSFQGDFVIEVKETGQPEVSISSSDNQLEKTQSSAEEEDRSTSLEQVRVYTIFVASRFDVRTSVPNGYVARRGDLPMATEETTTIDLC